MWNKQYSIAISVGDRVSTFKWTFYLLQIIYLIITDSDYSLLSSDILIIGNTTKKKRESQQRS